MRIAQRVGCGMGGGGGELASKIKITKNLKKKKICPRVAPPPPPQDPSGSVNSQATHTCILLTFLYLSLSSPPPPLGTMCVAGRSDFQNIHPHISWLLFLYGEIKLLRCSLR